tara:strand:+ start:377 stop:682 length:306 start_codon:yes stop_codon:yes gene_type:complete
MSCNNCNHIDKRGISQYCEKVGGKEIIIDQSTDCPHYLPTPKATNQVKGGNHLRTTLNFRGDKLRPHDINESDFSKLKSSGMLWELYPDAPDTFPANNLNK